MIFANQENILLEDLDSKNSQSVHYFCPVQWVFTTLQWTTVALMGYFDSASLYKMLSALE